MIVEIIGLAGTGKSTLSNVLSKCTDQVILETPPFYRRTDNISFFVRNLFLFLPSMLRIYLHKNGRYPSWEQLVGLVILNGWHRVLNQRAFKEDKIYILDQGAIYLLVELTLFGPERIKQSNVKLWWDHVFRNWAETIDLVIWLDTSLPVLVERIRSREIWHSIKDRNDDDAYQYLELYRRAYESVISRLMTCSTTLKVFRLDTGQNSLKETLEKVVNELHLEGGQFKPQENNC
jgi:deoxyadenosine/deoxycytidine kinase